jgi:hypothetical protein
LHRFSSSGCGKPPCVRRPQCYNKRNGRCPHINRDRHNNESRGTQHVSLRRPPTRAARSGDPTGARRRARRGRTARSHQARGRGPQCGVSAFRQPLGDPASGPIRHGRQFFDIEGGRAGPVFGQRRAIAQHDGDRFADIAARGRELTILPQIRTSTSRHRRGARFAPDSSLEEAVTSEPVSEMGIRNNARFRGVCSTVTAA